MISSHLADLKSSPAMEPGFFRSGMPHLLRAKEKPPRRTAEASSYGQWLYEALYVLVAMLVRDLAEHQSPTRINPRLQAKRERLIVAVCKKTASPRHALHFCIGRKLFWFQCVITSGHHFFFLGFFRGCLIGAGSIIRTHAPSSPPQCLMALSFVGFLSTLNPLNVYVH